MTNAIAAPANISGQTRADLKSILEIIDQRLHEVVEDGQGQHDQDALERVRKAAVGVLDVG